jgi:hypothetical protein
VQTIVRESTEEVVARTQEYFEGSEWQHTYGGLVSRPFHVAPQVQVAVPHSILPETGLSWLINLTLTALTLGSWLVIFILYKLMVVGSPRYGVTVQAHPTAGGTRVVTRQEGKAPEWEQAAFDWITRTFSVVEAKDAHSV